MQAQLIANDIACRRGDRLLFKGLTLACEAGDAVHVAGANGVGKSSLLRILAGLLRPFAGKVETSGAIGLVDERLALDPNQPLGKALGFWEQLDSVDQPGRVYGLLQIEALLDVPVRFLSTGQKKRAALARLLNSSSPIWLLDEPLNGLDTEAQRTVETLVAEHCEGGGIAVVASHQQISLPGNRTVSIGYFS
ncbi:heme ABC exporter ATP-binding protein CcmA [Qipengyuania sp. 1XM1-15A]|uniref:heme ABC exporter ATP-binding protein CcmA n=1 Tax=Qipengyuania xiamenensis TaxID=2867237 RepID=UPI001C87E9A8|nr:heme ABC exporter ATP-binding protein CcmA [Qipengyuania xiamenensis]MBX7533206.1 heme ABC exporter ATP-binding protein CcmA [Qipengyuania xiamenensis]